MTATISGPKERAREDFIALDGEIEGGSVKRIEHGAETGQWMGSMTLVSPGPAFNRPTNGTTETRGQAVRALVESWRAFRRYYGIED